VDLTKADLSGADRSGAASRTRGRCLQGDRRRHV